MGVLKRYNGKKVTPKDKNWSKGTWYVWKRLAGKVIHKSIPEAQTKEQAELAERKIIEREFNRRYGVADRTQFKEFTKVYEKYVRQRNVNITAKLQYINILNTHFGGMYLSDISPQDCRDLQYQLQHRKRKGNGTLAPASVNRIMSTLSKAFSLACEEGLLDRNPMQYVKSLKEPPPRSRLLTTEEKERLWKELEKDELMFRLVTLAVNAPLRRGQLFAITPDAVDLENGQLIIAASKGRSSRVIPLNNSAQNTLRLMLKDGQIPFPLRDFRKRWWKALRNAKIENFTFHDLRKEFASELLRRNVNPNIVQKLFAHSDMSITNVYLHADQNELAKAVNTLDATNSQPTNENGDYIN